VSCVWCIQAQAAHRDADARCAVHHEAPAAEEPKAAKGKAAKGKRKRKGKT
jgi:hypothetical protein